MSKKEETIVEAIADTKVSTLTAKFSKEQLLKSETYKPQKDLINALLENNKTYSKAEVDELINKYLKGRVN